MPHTPTQFFWKYPPAFFVVFYTQMRGGGGGAHNGRRYLRRPWKLGLRIITPSKPRMFCEESLEKIKFRTFPKVSVHEFCRLKALITLEQVNTTEWSKKKIRILISKTAMVGCRKLSLYANDSCNEHAIYFRR